MPLVHSKSKKAFSQNVQKEMAAGKPQNQAVAIAYSEQRKHMNKGGYCEHGYAEGGCPKCYAKGGTVDRLHQGANEARKYSSQKEEKGINTPRMPYPHNPDSFGQSNAGYAAEVGKHGGVKSRTREEVRPGDYSEAKAGAKRVLGEMKSMPGPTSGKSGFAEGGEVNDHDADDMPEHDAETQALHESIAGELHDALSKKDRKATIEAIHAIMAMRD